MRLGIHTVSKLLPLSVLLILALSAVSSAQDLTSLMKKRNSNNAYWQQQVDYEIETHELEKLFKEIWIRSHVDPEMRSLKI